MKRVKLNRGVILLVLMMLFLVPAKANKKIERIIVDKKFHVVKNASLSVEHKFGQIRCKNWNESSISVKVTVSVEAANADKAQKIIDKIDIKLNGNQNGVTVESEFSDRIFNNNTNNEISIDIDIMMPEAVKLNLENQFGNTYIENVSASSNINVEYGSIEINALKSELNSLEIGFGEAKINYLHMGEIELSYSSLSIGESSNLNIETSYSSFSIDEVEILEIENEGGGVDVGTVSEIELSSSFSDFNIDNLLQQVSAETDYGSLKILNISNDFSQVDINNTFGSVKLEFDSNASFNIEAEMEFCDLNYSGSEFNFSSKIIESNEKYYKGSVGSNPGKAKVHIESSFGSIIIDF